MNKELKFFKGLIRNISTCCPRVSWIKPPLKVAVVNALLLVVFSCSFSIGDGMYIDNPEEVELGIENVGDFRADAKLVTNTTFDVQDSGTTLNVFELNDDSEELGKEVDIKSSVSITTAQTSLHLVLRVPRHNYLSLTKQLPIIRT
jgi:hypothetical protein